MPTTFKRDFESLVQHYASANERIWEAEWARADLSRILVDTLHKEQIQQIAGSLGHSHRPIYDRAELARWWPASMRRLDRSVREHARIMRLFADEIPQASQSIVEAWYAGQI